MPVPVLAMISGIQIGMDVTASKLYMRGESKYDLDFKTSSQKLTKVELINIYKSIAHNYPVTSIEGPYGQDNWDNYTALATNVQIAGDDC